jgi:general secretion pathway protein H
VRARPLQRGFTLIELLVALVIAGIALSMVAINGLPGSQRGLRFEAERLSQLLSLARDEAQVRGQPMRLQADQTGYRFLVLRDRRWQPLNDDAELRARRWEEPTRLLLQRPDGRGEIEFGRDSVDVPFTVRLVREDASVSIFANGLGFFEVRQ